MVRKGSYLASDGAQLEVASRIGPAQLSTGFYASMAEDAQYRYLSYRTRTNSGGYGWIALDRGTFGTRRLAPRSIRVDKSSGRACLLGDGGSAKACRSGVPFRFMRRETLAENDLQQKLIYVGRAGNSILLRYWENSGHFARGERAQEYTVDARLPREFEVEGARIQLLEANRTSIRYRLIENFPATWAVERRTAALER